MLNDILRHITTIVIGVIIMLFITISILNNNANASNEQTEKDDNNIIWECRNTNNEILYEYYNNREVLYEYYNIHEVAHEYSYEWSINGQHMTLANESCPIRVKVRKYK